MWKLLIVALAATTALVGCKDERNNFMVDDSISFLNEEALANVALYNEKYEFPVLKNGKGQQTATAVVEPSETALAEYNTANGTDFVLMPANCYKLSANAIKFSEKDIRKFVDVTWNTSDVADLDATKNYAIALQLSVANSALQVDKDRSVMIIAPKKSTVSMEALASGTTLSPAASREVVNFDGKIVIDTPISVMDVNVNYAIDNSLIAAYNEANGTNYLPAPSGLVTMAAESSTILAGEASTTFTCKVNSAQLFNGNELKAVDNNQYLIPVSISSTTEDGINITNNVVYIPFSMNKQVKGPWTILEGQENCAAMDPARPGANFDKYTSSKLFDGAFGDPGSWLSVFWTFSSIKFPMVFVVDMGKTQVFTKFVIYDYVTHQGQYRDFEFYVADEYNASTKWNLVASGTRLGVEKAKPGDANTPTEDPHDFAVQKMISGRYLKVVIVKPTWTVAPYDSGRGKLGDIQGMGF